MRHRHAWIEQLGEGIFRTLRQAPAVTTLGVAARAGFEVDGEVFGP